MSILEKSAPAATENKTTDAVLRFTNIGKTEDCAFCDSPKADIFVAKSNAPGICTDCLADARFAYCSGDAE